MASRALLLEYNDICKEVIEFIDENYNDSDICLDDFCMTYEYSRRRVQRALSAHNMSWRFLVRNKRIQIAGHKLLHTKLTVREIAGSVGYEHYSHFTNMFRSVFGLNPSEYRATFGGNNG